MGWYSPASRLYLEFTADGVELGRYVLPVEGPQKPGTSAAICDDGSVHLGAPPQPNTAGLSTFRALTLNRSTKTWDSTETPLKQATC